MSTRTWTPREVAERSGGQERPERRVVVASTDPLDLLDALLEDLDEASR